MQRSRANKGTTFISVLMALALLAMVAAIFASAFDVALNSSKVVGNTAQALSLAQHKVDQMRAMGYGRLDYSELVSAGVIDANPDSQPYSFRVVDSLSVYFAGPTGAITITEPEPGLRRVDVRVAWAGSRKTQGEVNLVALIARD